MRRQGFRIIDRRVLWLGFRVCSLSCLAFSKTVIIMEELKGCLYVFLTPKLAFLQIGLEYLRNTENASICVPVNLTFGRWTYVSN
jgi:hypothetical protein